MRSPRLQSRATKLRIYRLPFLESFVNRPRNNGVHSVAKCGEILLTEVLGFDDIVEIDGDCARTEQPARLLVEFKRANHADGDDRRAKFHGHAEYAVLERADAAISRTLPFRKNGEADARVERGARQPPHAFQIGRAIV